MSAARKTTARGGMAAALAARILAVATAAAQVRWPSPYYREHPVAFFRDVLGVQPWAKQIEVIEAVRDHKRVAVRAGHKVSKSHTIGGIALWFYCGFDDARVVMSSVTDRQVNQVLWRQLKMMLSRAGRCADCREREPFGASRCKACETARPIPEHPKELARSGLKSNDYREITGYTAKEAEAVAGVSGKHLLYLLDEASGIPDEIFEAIEGNRAGGARVVMMGNPTRQEGTFFRAFGDKAEFWKKIHISSEDSPNVTEGREIIPGLATREWVEEMRAEWGEESALYQVRVGGNFARAEDSKVVPLHLIADGEERWADTPAEGRLHVGVDPARFGDDDSAIAPRRGQKVLEVVAKNGLDTDPLAALVMQVVRSHRRPREDRALVKVDVCGRIGIALALALKAFEAEVEVVPVNVSNRSRFRREYPHLRDELWFGVKDWLKDGGALPTDPKLSAELHAPKYSFDGQQRMLVETKDEIRKRLKRSPDRADAVALSIYDPSAYTAREDKDEDEAADLALERARPGRAQARRGALDPYGATPFNPYGSGPLTPYGGAR